MSKEYKLTELHSFLANTHNIQTILLNNQLNYKDKIFVFFDKKTR